VPAVRDGASVRVSRATKGPARTDRLFYWSFLALEHRLTEAVANGEASTHQAASGLAGGKGIVQRNRPLVMASHVACCCADARG